MAKKRTASGKSAAEKEYRLLQYAFPDPEEYQQKWRAGLDLLLAVDAPPPLESFYPEGWTAADRELFLQRTGPFVVSARGLLGQPSLCLNPQLAKRLEAEEGQSAYSASGRRGAWLLAQSISHQFCTSRKLLTPYQRLHFIEAMKRAGLEEEALTFALDSMFVYDLLSAGNEVLETPQRNEASLFYQEACALGEAMVQKRGTPADRQAWGAALCCFGYLRLRQGKLDDAETYLTQSYQLRSQVAQEEPENNNACIETALTLRFLATTQMDRKDLRGALETCRKGLEWAEACTFEDSEAVLQLQSLRMMAADLHRQLGETQEALDFCQTAIQEDELRLEELGDPACRTRLASVYALSARIHESLGKPRDALSLIRKSLEYWGELEDWEHRPSEELVLWSSALILAGDLEELLVDDKPAVACYEQAITISKELVRRDGSNRQYAELLSQASSQAAYLEVFLDLNDISDRTSLKALEQQRAAVAENPDTYNKMMLVEALRTDAETLCCHYELEEALKEYEECMEVCRDLLKGTEGLPDAQHFLREYCAVCSRTAEILEELEELDKALELFQQSVRLRIQLAEEDASPENMRDLSATYDDMAGIVAYRGDHEAAIEYFEKSYQIFHQLVQDAPTPENLADLAILCANYAQNKKALNDLPGALSLNNERISLCSAVVKKKRNQQTILNLIQAQEAAADILILQKKPEEALVLLEKSLELYQKINARTKDIRRLKAQEDCSQRIRTLQKQAKKKRRK